METRIDNLVEILAFLMLIMGLMLSLTRTVRRMIQFYRYQCFCLAAVTFLTALEQPAGGLQIGSGLFVVIPILLAVCIEPLLAQATVTENIPAGQRLMRWFKWSIQPKARQEVLPGWLQSRRARQGIVTLLAVDLAIAALAFVTAYTFAGSAMSQINALVLAVSFALLLLGLSTMVFTEDIISQVIGLLMMEQGMFLAAVRCILRNEIRIVFVLGLFLYTIITLTILVLLLPELHQKSGSLDIEQQGQLKG